MPLLTLMRRRTQTQLLADACARQRAARLAVRSRGGSDTTPTRLLSLDRHCIWIEWPDEPAESPAPSEESVEVFFEHDGDRYAFRAQTYGQFYRYFDAHGVRSALRLSLPSRIERRQQREHFRVSLAAFAPVEARLTQMGGGERSIACHILNVSCGGMAALAPWQDAEPLTTGQCFWAEFELPGVPTPFEFAVRLTHRRRTHQGDRAIVGCMFTGSDDHTASRHKLERIRRFVTHQQRQMLKRNATG